MKAYMLTQSNTNILLDIEESGHGYQIIEILTGNNEIPNGSYIAFNSELLIDLNDYFQFLEGSDELNPPLAFTSYSNFVKSIKPKPAKLSLLPSLSKKATVPPPWILSPTLIAHAKTSGPEIFWRLSSVNPDPRIVSGVLAAGSYLTTDEDLKLVTSGFGAVGRYALPSPFPASYKTECRLPAGTAFHIGTTRPNFGQAGGGVEVLITIATTLAPFIPAVKIPEW